MIVRMVLEKGVMKVLPRFTRVISWSEYAKYGCPYCNHNRFLQRIFICHNQVGFVKCFNPTCSAMFIVVTDQIGAFKGAVLGGVLKMNIVEGHPNAGACEFDAQVDYHPTALGNRADQSLSLPFVATQYCFLCERVADQTFVNKFMAVRALQETVEELIVNTVNEWRKQYPQLTENEAARRARQYLNTVLNQSHVEWPNIERHLHRGIRHSLKTTLGQGVEIEIDRYNFLWVRLRVGACQEHLADLQQRHWFGQYFGHYVLQDQPKHDQPSLLKEMPDVDALLQDILRQKGEGLDDESE